MSSPLQNATTSPFSLQNTGWVSRSGTFWDEALQAVSHYSYHVSSGQFLLCDLQGGEYRDGVVLTDPVIMSRHQSFGSTDLGPAGISSFFANHVCGRNCDQNWTRPADQWAFFNASSHTTMVPRAPHGQGAYTHGLPAMSAFQPRQTDGYDEDDDEDDDEEY